MNMKRLLTTTGIILLATFAGCTTTTTAPEENVEGLRMVGMEAVSNLISITNTPTPTPTPSALDLATTAIEEKKYEKALEYLEDVKYEDKISYLQEIASGYIEAYNVEAARKIISEIEKIEPEDAVDLRRDLKYSNYVYDPCRYDDECIPYDIKDIDIIESELSLFYGNWYDHRNNNAIIEITEYTINGREYGVYSLYSAFGEHPELFYFFMDEPEKIYDLALEELPFTLWGGVPTNIYWIHDDGWYYNYGNPNPFFTINDLEGYQIDKERMEQMSNEQHEWKLYEASLDGMGRIPVYEAAKKEFKNVLNASYSLTEQMYMTITYQDKDDIYYYYDNNSKMYDIVFEVTVGESFGFIQTTYTCSARLYEAVGNRLKVASFNIY